MQDAYFKLVAFISNNLLTFHYTYGIRLPSYRNTLLQFQTWFWKTIPQKVCRCFC